MSSIKKDELEKRAGEIPMLISKLQEEYNQVLGYLKCLQDIEESKKSDKKKQFNALSSGGGREIKEIYHGSNTRFDHKESLPV